MNTDNLSNGEFLQIYSRVAESDPAQVLRDFEQRLEGAEDLLEDYAVAMAKAELDVSDPDSIAVMAEGCAAYRGEVEDCAVVLGARIVSLARALSRSAALSTEPAVIVALGEMGGALRELEDLLHDLRSAPWLGR